MYKEVGSVRLSEVFSSACYRSKTRKMVINISYITPNQPDKQTDSTITTNYPSYIHIILRCLGRSGCLTMVSRSFWSRSPCMEDTVKSLPCIFSVSQSTLRRVLQ